MEMEEIKRRLEELKQQTKEKSVQLSQRDHTFNSSIKDTSIKNASLKNVSTKSTSFKNVSAKSYTSQKSSSKRICINNKYYNVLSQIGTGGSSIVNFSLYLTC